MPASIKKEVIEYFQNQTESEIKSLVNTWNIRSTEWLNQAYSFMYTQQHVDELKNTETFHLKKTASELYKKWISSHDKESLKNIEQQAREQINNMQAYQSLAEKRAEARIKILTDGYVLLNEIGEKIRNETITYSVTATADNAAINVSGCAKTWTLSLDQFLGYAVTFSSSRIMLKKSSTLFNLLQNQGASLKEAEVWDEQRRKKYLEFIEVIKNIKNNKYKKVNEGNILEGFLNWEKKTDNTSMEDAFIESIKGNEAFYRKGDIDSLQVKGPFATVTNISSLINAIEKVHNILNNPSYQLKGINKNIREQVDSLKIEQTLTDSTEKIAKNLLKMFGG